jgi:hypothetical protein
MTSLALDPTAWTTSTGNSVPTQLSRKEFVISAFCRDVKICALLLYNAASGGNPLQTFRDNVSIPSSRYNIFLTLKKGATSSINSERSDVSGNVLFNSLFVERDFRNVGTVADLRAGNHSSFYCFHTPWKFQIWNKHNVINTSFETPSLCFPLHASSPMACCGYGFKLQMYRDAPHGACPLWTQDKPRHKTGLRRSLVKRTDVSEDPTDLIISRWQLTHTQHTTAPK